MNPEKRAENIVITDICPHCGRRIFKKTDGLRGKRTYTAPRWMRNLFKQRVGIFPLGSYRLVRCEVCERSLAMFDKNTGALRDNVVVLYNCTLLSKPLGSIEVNGKQVDCKSLKNCYDCPIRKSQEDLDVGR